MPTFPEAVAALALLGGTFFTAVAAIGLLRLPDVFCRLQAAGKAGTLGVGLAIVAAMVLFSTTEGSILVRGALAIFFQFLTTPASTHLLARAAYVTEYPLSERTAVDELKSYLPSRPRESYGQE